MILIVDRTGGYWRGWVYDDHHGVPISGASVSLLIPGFQTRHYFATTTANPQGYWSFEYCDPTPHEIDVYILEVISGAEKVTIEGDQVRVEVPEPRRPVASPWYRRMWGL